MRAYSPLEDEATHTCYVGGADDRIVVVVRRDLSVQDYGVMRRISVQATAFNARAFAEEALSIGDSLKVSSNGLKECRHAGITINETKNR